MEEKNSILCHKMNLDMYQFQDSLMAPDNGALTNMVPRDSMTVSVKAPTHPNPDTIRLTGFLLYSRISIIRTL